MRCWSSRHRSRRGPLGNDGMRALLLAAVAAAVLLSASCMPFHLGTGDRPNFLIIIVDEMRADDLAHSWPGRRGGSKPIKTPHLDRLTERGVHLSRSYTVHPYCMPSRATLLTGLMPHAHGVRSNGVNFPHDLPNLVEALVAAGYRSHLVGKAHFTGWNLPWNKKSDEVDPRNFPEARVMWREGKITAVPTPYFGFQSIDFLGGHGPGVWGDYFRWLDTEHPDQRAKLNFDNPGPAPQSFKLDIDPEYHYNSWIADRAIEFLREHSTREADGQPFFLWTSFPDPHYPWATPEPFYSMYDRAAVPVSMAAPGELEKLPPHLVESSKESLKPFKKSGANLEEQLRELTAISFGMITFVDQQIGRMLAELEALGLDEDTVVIFLADHGDTIGDHGLIRKGPYAFSSVYQIPSIWSYPKEFESGLVSGALTTHLDFAPTMLELAKLPPLSYFSVDEPEIEDFGKLAPLAGRSLVPVFTGNAEAVQDAVLVENDDDFLPGRLRTLYTERYQLTVYVGDEGELPFGMLFDMQEDPRQVNNLWDDPGSQELKTRLKLRMLAETIRVQNRSPRLHTGY